MTLKDRINRPIGSDQIEAYFQGISFSDNPFKVMMIEDLQNLNIDQIFRGNRTFEIFFIDNPEHEVGHFVSLIYRSDAGEGEQSSQSRDAGSRRHSPVIELFDPAGVKNTEKHVRPYLEDFVMPFADNNGVRIEFNRSSFQSRYSSTCHRAVIFRCMLSYLTVDEFMKVIDNDNFKNYDEFFATVIQY